MSLGELGVWFFTDAMSSKEAAGFAQDIEAMGYGALWIPEAVGRNPFAHAAWLLANTSTLMVATGIASIYNRDPGATMAAARTLAEQSGGRFVLGLGVSHRPMVEGVRGHEYGKPVTTMRDYLDNMQKAPYAAVRHDEDAPVVLAALGPRMLELAGTQAQGAHPYFTTPEHTRQAREVLGAGPLLCVEQKAVLTTDAEEARRFARATAAMYLGLENYRNNWKRMGFSDSDLADGGSDRFIDATFAWGSGEVIRSRVRSHLDAGASHVCIQPVNREGNPGKPDLELLKEVAPASQ